MASYHGKDGSVSWINATAIDTVTSWSITTAADMAETTSMENSANPSDIDGYKTYITGFLEWSASVEAIVDTTGLYPDLDNTGIEDRDGAALILHGGTTASARKFTGNAICTGITTSLESGDVVKVTYNFIGSGTLLEEADA